MELNTGRLEPASRIQEGPFGQAAERRRPGNPPRRRQDGKPTEALTEDEVLREEQPESHQLDDLA